jgi:hypothetical protein
MGRRGTSRRGRRLLVALGLLALASPLVAGAALGEEPANLPDEFTATSSAAGFSFVQVKQPNPLPVGPGAFLTFELPEVAGNLTASSSTARTSLLYPGPVVAGLPALLCTAGATPFCGQAPPPVLAEADSPQKPDAALVTDGLSFRQPAAPVTTGAGSGEAHTTATSSTSRSQLGGYAVAAPDPARQAVLDALRATLGRIPGAKVDPDPALLSIGGATLVQTIEPVGHGELRTEAVTRISDVHLLAGAVRIDSIVVSAFAVTDGDAVHRTGSATKASGVLVAGFPASIGPDGFTIDGRGDGGAGRVGLNGVAEQVGQAVATATGKLRLEVRDGRATHDDDGAAADGLRVSLANPALTDTSPPQVSALCTVTSAIQDPMSAGGLSLPPICAVPDLTGTADSYDFLLGRAAVTSSAQRFPAFDEGGSGVVPGLGGDLGGDLGAPTGIGTGSGPLGDAGGRRPAALVDLRRPGFLQLEARWLGGSRAADRFADVYLALVGFATLLLLTSRVVPRFARTRFRKEAP